MGDGIRRQSDIWYHASRSRFSGKDKGIKGLVVRALIKAVLFTGIPVAPYLSLAFKKMK
jgi:hypothetical protein